jgi:hypothetical protein
MTLKWLNFEAGQITQKWLIESLRVGRRPTGFWSNLSTQIFSDFSRFYSLVYSQNEKNIGLSRGNTSSPPLAFSLSRLWPQRVLLSRVVAQFLDHNAK